jgi:uncharacterized membrane protein
MGIREIATGLAVLARPNAPAPLWARVAGDAVDLALLGRVMGGNGTRSAPAIAATIAVAGVTLVDVLTALDMQARETDPRDRTDLIEVAAAITIRRSLAEVYDFWRHIENFPAFMRDLESVRDLGGGRSQWVVAGPAGIRAEWEAEVITDQHNHLISWRSVPGSTVENRGAVRFEHAAGGRGTEVHVEIKYRPPLGRAGAAAAWLTGKSARGQIREGLRRVKQLLEVGEIPLSEGPGLSRPAQPAARTETLSDISGVAR